MDSPLASMVNRADGVAIQWYPEIDHDLMHHHYHLWAIIMNQWTISNYWLTMFYYYHTLSHHHHYYWPSLAIIIIPQIIVIAHVLLSLSRIESSWLTTISSLPTIISHWPSFHHHQPSYATISHHWGPIIHRSERVPLWKTLGTGRRWASWASPLRSSRSGVTKCDMSHD